MIKTTKSNSENHNDENNFIICNNYCTNIGIVRTILTTKKTMKNKTLVIELKIIIAIMTQTIIINKNVRMKSYKNFNKR